MSISLSKAILVARECAFGASTSVDSRIGMGDDGRSRETIDAIATLSNLATLTIADTYSTEDMGVVFAPGYHEQIIAERTRLNQNLGQVSRLWTELNVTISEVQRGVGSLQFMIDPENN